MTAAALEQATEHQLRARSALDAALREGPSHAYLITGPAGSGKAASTRAFVAEILADGSPDATETRRRAMLDPSPHPDLVWLRPVGMSHAVEDVRTRLIRLAPLKPFEGKRRVFVVEAAEALNDESQNAMLKTLEEPPPHAHLILIASDAEAVLPTVASRCQRIEFEALPEEAIASRLGPGVPAETATAAARLSRGDLGRARLLAGSRGAGIRASVEKMMAGVLDDRLADSPWIAVLDSAGQTGDAAAERVSSALADEAEEGVKRTKKETEDAVNRARRRARTGVLELSLSLAGSWARDWAAVAAGAETVIYNADRVELLREQADGIRVAAARDAVTMIADTRRRFELNVSEELAFEALCFRMTRLFNPA
jgi:DNA polymerase-3 subunit delta'